MKNKFNLILILTLILSFIFIGVTTKAENSQIQISHSIEAIYPKDETTINIGNPYINTLFTKYENNIEFVDGLVFRNDEMSSFASNLNNQEYIRNLYKKYDDFYPVNTTIKWNNVDGASSYIFTLSSTLLFNTCLYQEEVVLEEVDLKNVLYPNRTYYWMVIASLDSGEKLYSNIFKFNTLGSIRTIVVDGVSNTRDIGGLKGEFGSTLYGLVYRCGRLDDITDDGINTLNDLKVKTDLDLRALNEGLENPSNRDISYPYQNFMLYSNIFYDFNNETICKVLRYFADENNYPIIFHCSVGRDRTGTLSFILNSLLGVKKEDIIAEFLTSLFSVTGQTTKGDSSLIDALNSMYNYIDYNYPGETYAKKTENYLLSIGMEKSELDKIRDILTGKIKVLDLEKENTLSFVDKAFVTIKNFSFKDEVIIVDKGSKINPPYELEEGYYYTLNGEKFNLDSEVNENITLIVKKEETCTLRISSPTKESTKVYKKNQEIDFNEFKLEGYETIIFDSNGEKIESLILEKDDCISIVYIQK